MPENSIQNQASYPQPKVVSISKNAEKREPIKYNKPHCIIPIADMTWVLNQAKSIQKLWNECWQSDPFGSRWVKLTTTLKSSAFRLARRALSAAGLFEFKRETSTNDSRKTESWSVINLHGARRIKDFWNSESIAATDSEISATDSTISATHSTISATDSAISAAAVADISTETIVNTGVPEALSNSSLSSQELLKEEVPEEVTQETTMNELSQRVRSRGTKIADKLAAAMERCMKLSAGEEPEQSFRELFITRYKWKIDEERFKQLLQLTKSCTLSFFEKFKYVYKNDGMSAPRTFDKAISLVIKNASSINEAVNLQLAAFNYQPT
ncbi:hypothetical protein [Nostoc sp.]|uniref:hypothetical protein n=1 Tax=Nostoc sp. TaxID=1180 RepID=UPI002FF50943